MSDREKLIELLTIMEEVPFRDYSGIANYLISNGVTVQKWIPVSERLPTEEDADEYEAVYAISKGSYPKRWHWTKVAEIPDHFTHWMPLPPEPPKECE